MFAICILVVTVLAGLWAVMTRSILRAAIALAAASALVAVLMFKLNSPLAAVFELSVCSGLISVLFISTISLAAPETARQKETHRKARFKRFRFLPVLLVLVIFGLSLAASRFSMRLPEQSAPGKDARLVLWQDRPFDLVGQVIILLAGVFGVVTLFKESKEE